MLVSCTGDRFYRVDNCQIDPVDGGQRVTCGQDSVVVPDQMPILAIIDPCGDGLGYDEVIIKLQGPLYLAWYQNLGLVVLNENQNYSTTDAQQCGFRIVNGELVLL